MPDHFPAFFLFPDSGIANYQCLDIETSHNAYMDFSKTPGTIADSPVKRAMLGNAAQAMAADIGRAIATGQLSAAEVNQLQGVLAGLTGDAELAQAYVEVSVADADAASEKVRSSGRESVSSLRRKRTPCRF